MNKWNLVAAALMTITLGVHVFAGGPEIHNPIQTSGLSEYLRAFSAVLWHAVTVVLGVLAIGYAWLVKHENKPLVMLMGAIQFGFAVLFLWYGLTQLGTVWPMPQWTIFLLIPALSMAGIRWRHALPV